MKKSLSVVLFVLVMCSQVFAARPFSVEDSGVLEKGFELELGYAGNTDGNSKEYEKGFVLNASLIPEKLQIGYERNYTDAPYHSWGAGDSTMALKYGLSNDQAVKVGISMIDGDEKSGFGNEYTEYGLTYAHDFNFDKLTIFSSLGYTTYNSGKWCNVPR